MIVQVEEAVQACVAPDRVLDRSRTDTDPEVHRAISAGRHPLYPDLTEAGR